MEKLEMMKQKSTDNRLKHRGLLILLFLLAVIMMTVSPVHAKTRLSKTSLTLTSGKSAKLRVKGTSKKVKWSSSNKNVAVVKKGRVTAKHPGNAIITAKVGKKRLKCKVTVKSKVVQLGDMDIFDDQRSFTSMFYTTGSVRDHYLTDNYGNHYSHSFYVSDNEVTYLTNHKYRIFSGTVACPKDLQADGARESATLTILGDGEEIAVFRDYSNLSRPTYFNLNIQNYERITLRVSCKGYNIWSNWGCFATIFNGKFLSA